MVTEHTLAQAAIDLFARDGDVTALAALADQRDEVGDHRFAKRVRVLLARDTERREAVKFFLRMTGRVRGESEQAERLKAAMGMARIERWKEACCEVEWMPDENYNPDDYGPEGMPDDGYGCVVTGYAWRDGIPIPRSGIRESLWGVTFGGSYSPMHPDEYTPGDDDNYRRFVEAELAEELFGQVMCRDQ